LEKADLTYLKSMSDGNEELILEMIDIFIDQVKEIWGEMEDSLEKKDIDTLGKLAHKAKSSLAIMGMDSTAQSLKDLELYCNENTNLELYQGIISNFKSDCLIAIDELLSYKKDHLTDNT